jgi:4-oxalocrotonate tautomerase
MPVIFFYGPQMTKEKKRELVQGFTQHASKVTGIDEAAFVVQVQESNSDNVGVGGELLADRFARQGK